MASKAKSVPQLKREDLTDAEFNLLQYQLFPLLRRLSARIAERRQGKV